MQPAISVRQLTKIYSSGTTQLRALNAVDMDVQPGELVLLMGPSGSGKTTLLSIVGCILRASSGSIRILGQEVSHLNEKQLPRIRLAHIGFVFQGFNLFPALTAGENVELALNLKGVYGSDARRAAAALLDQVGLGDKYSSWPANLSGGQKQRIAIARALAGEPNIILADEPTGSLDSQSGRMVMELMRRLARERNRTVVLVTHDNRILDYADRVIQIEDGKIGQGGHYETNHTLPKPVDIPAWSGGYSSYEPAGASHAANTSSL
jgi:putative ABC transport system ATP-binding protein